MPARRALRASSGLFLIEKGPGDVFRESKLYYFCRRKNKGTV